MTLISNRIVNHRIAWPVLVAFAGVAYGLLILGFFLFFKNTYATFLAMAATSPFLVLVVGDCKRLLIGLLTILLPITIDMTLGHTGQKAEPAGYVLSFFDVVLVSLYILWILELVSKHRKQTAFYLPLPLPVFSFFLFLSFSVVAAPRPDLGFFSIIEIIKMYLVLIYLANNIRTKGDLKFLLFCLVFGLFFEGVLGTLQHRYGEPFFPTALGGPSFIEQRVMGSWRSYNDFAWYLTFILPVAFVLLFSEINHLFKLFCGLAFVFGSAALAWTSSRAGWISLAAALVFAVVPLLPRIKATAKKFVNVFLVLMLVAAFSSVLAPRLYQKVHGRLTADDRGSYDSRWPQYEMAYKIFLDNPIIGVGLNNYTQVTARYDQMQEGIESITEYAVHNIFLLVLAETGILGFMAYIWMFFAIFFKGAKSILSNTGFEFNVTIGLLGGILAFLVHGLVDVAPLGGKMYVFVWFFAGMICAIETMHNHRSDRVSEPIPI